MLNFGSLDGVDADHETLVVEVKIRTRHQFKIEKYRYRGINDENVAEFVSGLGGVDWERAIRGDSIQEVVSGFDRILMEVLDRTVPKVEKTRKTTDDPWIHDGIRRAIKRRKAVFRLQKRSALWKSMKKHTDGMIAEAKKRYYLREAEKAKSIGSGKIAYQAINNLRTSERPRQWTMDDLANGRTDEQLLEDRADYYEQITEGFEPAVKGLMFLSERNILLGGGDPHTKLHRLWLLQLRPDQVHDSPSQGPPPPSKMVPSTRSTNPSVALV